MRKCLAEHRDEAQADAVVAGARRRRDELRGRELECGEVREPDVALHWVPNDLKCCSMRSASGSRPVNRRNAAAAWNTAMPPPSTVRQPLARATRRSSVSSGT